MHSASDVVTDRDDTDEFGRKEFNQRCKYSNSTDNRTGSVNQQAES